MLGLPLLLACLVSLPVAGQVTRPFAPPGHLGVDMAAMVGSEVRAVEAGVVWFAGSVAGNRAVTVETASSHLLTVSFLSSIAVLEGERVERGTLLGFSGFGHGSPLVHFSARLHGEYLDPQPRLSCLRSEGAGTLRLLPPAASLAYPSRSATRTSRRNVRPAPHGSPDPG